MVMLASFIAFATHASPPPADLNVARSSTTKAGDPAVADGAATSVPAFTRSVPVNVFTPVRVSSPSPSFVTVMPSPSMTPEYVSVPSTSNV